MNNQYLHLIVKLLFVLIQINLFGVGEESKNDLQIIYGEYEQLKEIERNLSGENIE